MRTYTIYFLLFFTIITNVFSQHDAAYMLNLRQGITHFGRGNWILAIESLEPLLNSSNNAVAAEAHFWTAMSRFSNNDFQKSIEIIETIFMFYPDYYNINELYYHKGRALFHLGFFDDAILTFNEYINTLGPDNNLDSASLSKKASSLFWVGESLLNMGHLDRAEDTFSFITINYPASVKYEASLFRIALIGQKRIEEELLRLLRLSHEESLRNTMEFQRRETAYEQAIIAFQNRIIDLESDTRLADLEADNAMYELELSLSRERIQFLEARLLEIQAMVLEQEQIQQLPIVEEPVQGLSVKTPGIWDNQLK